jgi:metallo-beta-lactamase family protein
MKITFHGAARCVTGSKHIITLNDGTHILIDCGMFQGMGPQTDELNETFGFDPKNISCLLLTHAHIDHSGLIPKLVREGFRGPVYCTAATKELTEILLYDSAEIQTYETDYINKLRSQHNLSPYTPLYTAEDVQLTMKLFVTVPYNEYFHISKTVEVMYTDAGHLIGSACIHLAITENRATTRISFSGDVGRYRSVLLPPPAVFPQADYVIMESTYGNKTHDIAFNTVDMLYNLIKQTCVVNKGKLIIPAFSVGRTQEVLFALNQLELEKRLPELSYFVDSPLSIKATSVIKAHKDGFNDKLQEILTRDDDPFHFNGLKYVESVADSKKLVEYTEPCVIISASGTADAGRVRHHIYNCLKEPNNAIVFVGYCQQKSLGGQLLQGVKSVELFGETCAVLANVDAISSMSAHGDADDLIRFISCQDPAKVKGIFLVHGEYTTQQAFAARLERKMFRNIIVPEHHRQYELK